jgi:Fe-S cluster biogenesis protein NfuA
MLDFAQVDEVLNLVRPALQADGGNVRLVDVDEDGVVTVELEGSCKGCPMSQLTLAHSVERILKEQLPEVTKVIPASA